MSTSDRKLKVGDTLTIPGDLYFVDECPSYFSYAQDDWTGRVQVVEMWWNNWKLVWDAIGRFHGMECDLAKALEDLDDACRTLPHWQDY